MGHGSSTSSSASAGDPSLTVDTFCPKSGISGGSAEENLAAMHVQSWCRRKISQRRKSNKLVWKLYTEMEYKNECDFLKLHKVFSNLGALQEVLERNSGLPEDASKDGTISDSDSASSPAAPDMTYIGTIRAGPMGLDPVKFTKEDVLRVMYRMQRGERLSIQVFTSLIIRAYKLQLTFPNVREFDVTEAGTCVVVGDLHGQFEDLLLIFEKSGLPSEKNPYVFNGDFVDRGPQSVEICSVLVMFQLLYPGAIAINRGNHEDFLVNKQFGFEAEIFKKYGPRAKPKRAKKGGDGDDNDDGSGIATPAPSTSSKTSTDTASAAAKSPTTEQCGRLVRTIACWFAAIPLGTVISNAAAKQRVCVLHGGISSHVTMERLQKIDRTKFASVMHTALVLNGTESLPTHFDYDGARTIVDCVWADPQREKGTRFNLRRGCGVCFGPDVTAKFVADHNFKFLVRSHECVEAGYYVTHDGKLITIFSASDYYSPGSNVGAFLRLDSKLDPHFFKFKGPSGRTVLPSTKLVESAALGEVFEVVVRRKEELRRRFETLDVRGTSVISLEAWIRVMTEVTELENIPWRSVRPFFVEDVNGGVGGAEVHVDDDDASGKSSKEDVDARRIAVNFEKTLRLHDPHSTRVKDSSIARSLYKDLDALEYIFRLIDADGSGSISIDEFVRAAKLLGQYTGSPMSDAEARRMAETIDMDHNGEIDLNEFVESFRLVEARAASA